MSLLSAYDNIFNTASKIELHFATSLVKPMVIDDVAKIEYFMRHRYPFALYVDHTRELYTYNSINIGGEKIEYNSTTTQKVRSLLYYDGSKFKLSSYKVFERYLTKDQIKTLTGSGEYEITDDKIKSIFNENLNFNFYYYLITDDGDFIYNLRQVNKFSTYDEYKELLKKEIPFLLQIKGTITLSNPSSQIRNDDLIIHRYDNSGKLVYDVRTSSAFKYLKFTLSNVEKHNLNVLRVLESI